MPSTTATATDHYTATVEIKEVTHTTKTDTYNNSSEVIDRNVRDVTKLVIRAKTLEGLRTKVAGHIALIGADD